MQGRMVYEYMKKNITAAVLFGLAAGLYPISVTYAVQAVPEPGADIKPVQEERKAEQAPQLDNQLGEAQTPAPEHIHFTMQEIHVEQPAESRLKQEKLEAIAAKGAGHDITVEDLDKVLTELTRYARSHGYPAAYAYVPEQKAQKGILTLRVELGHFDEIVVDNQASPRDEKRAQRLLAGLKPGGVVEERALETALFNVNDINGLESQGSLVPGRKEGTTSLHVTLKPGKKYGVTLYTDNYGSKSSGRYRYGLQADFMGLGHANSRFSVGGMLSNDHLHNYNVGYEVQLGHSGTTLGIRQSRMDYELGSLFQALGARGIANTTSLYGETPLWRTLGSSLSFIYGVDYRDIEDEMRTMGLSLEKHSYTGHLGLDGFWRSGKGTAVHGVLQGYYGHLGADSDWAQLTGEAADTLGNFSKGTLDLTALQSLGHSTDIMWKFQGQLAGHNLDSSEQMYLGGSRGVRAYPSGAGSGDQGVLSTLELRWHTPAKGLSLSTYFDVGTVNIAKDHSMGNSTLKGWGVGLSYTHPNHYFARIDYARRIGYEADTGRDGESKGRIWFMAGKSW